MASGIAADLTEAYRILMDPALRAKYNEDLLGAAGADAPPARRHPPAPPDPQPPPPPPPSAVRRSSRSGRAAGAARAPRRPRASISCKQGEPVDACARRSTRSSATPSRSRARASTSRVVSKPKRGLFKKAEESVRLLVKFVPLVDPEAVADVWPARVEGAGRRTRPCASLLIGPGTGPGEGPGDARSASSAARPRNAGPVLVPVDVRDWEALFPPDTPALGPGPDPAPEGGKALSGNRSRPFA